MSESKVNQKTIPHEPPLRPTTGTSPGASLGSAGLTAAEATIDPFKSLDRMPGAMKPNTPFPGNEGNPFDAEVCYARRASENNRPSDISRIETKWELSIVCILNRKQVNGRLRATCLFENGSEIVCDLSTEAVLFLKPSTNPSWKGRTSRVRFGDRVRNFGFLEQAVEFKNKLDPELKPEIIDLNTGEVIDCADDGAGGVASKLSEVSDNNDAIAPRSIAPRSKSSEVSDDNDAIAPRANDIMNDLVAKHHPNSLAAADQVNGDPVSCAICGRELTNPESRRIQIGPVCREKVGMKGESHLRGNFISQKLVEASRLYKDAKSRNWILQGCLQFDAPIPVMVIPQRDTEYWGLKRRPYLYYLSKDYKVHCIYKAERKLKYKRLTALSRETELDDMAWNEAKDLIETLEANGGKKPRTICL